MNNNTNKAMLLEISDQKQQNKSKSIEHVVMWINPEDKLPQIGELVLVRIKPTGNVVMFDNITDHGGWLNNSYVNDHKKHDVMAWMKIPKLNH